MPYRSDQERLRLENSELAESLAEANATIARLTGRRGAGAGWRDLINVDAELERRLPGRLDDDKLGEVAAMLAKRFDSNGASGKLGRHFTWSLPRTFEQARNVDVSLAEDEEGVVVNVRIRPARLGVALYAIIAGLVLPFAFGTAASYTHLPSLAMVTPLLLLSLLAANAALRRWRAHHERLAASLVRDIAEVVRVRTLAPAGLRIAAAASSDDEREELAERESCASEELDAAPGVMPARPNRG